MKAVCMAGFLGLIFASAGLEGGAFGCLTALAVGMVSGAVMFFGFVNSDLSA